MTEILSKQEITQFIEDGFVRIDNAFPKEIADAVVDILWNDIPYERTSPHTWSEPVVRLGMYTQQPFLESVNNSKLHAAFDQLVGANEWVPCQAVGTFPVRFPSDKEPNDTGKHVDASFPGDEPADYLKWRINIQSRGRGLLLLILYSDVTERDAPTVIYRKSHLDVARVLYPEGDAGLSFIELAGRLKDLPQHEEILAVGKAGTVYLCHPFLVHAAQSHRGSNPKFMAQPPLILRNQLTLDGDLEYPPVAQVIRLAVGLHYDSFDDSVRDVMNG